jgi:hypothetical protein
VTDRERIFDIRRKLLTRAFSYDQARIEAAPIIESMNNQARTIAKKHGKGFKGFTFSSLMR